MPSFVGRGRPPYVRDPFLTEAPGFFTYLREERGLRETSVRHYGHSLRGFERYLARIGVQRLAELSPAILSAFVTEAGRGLSGNSMTGLCSALRVFVRYAYREGVIARDLSGAVETPRKYRLSNVPRSISWDEVRRMLEGVDRRGAVGKRDFAILLLLVTYGLRAREVAALTLDDIDWERERLLVPERKAGHCTASEIGHGLGFRALVTPHAGATLGEGAARTLRAWARWTLGEEAAVALEGTRSTESALHLHGSLRF